MYLGRVAGPDCTYRGWQGEQTCHRGSGSGPAAATAAAAAAAAVVVDTSAIQVTVSTHLHMPHMLLTAKILYQLQVQPTNNACHLHSSFFTAKYTAMSRHHHQTPTYQGLLSLCFLCSSPHTVKCLAASFGAVSDTSMSGCRHAQMALIPPLPLSLIHISEPTRQP